MKLVALHRHPVKAMGGEVLDFAELDERGLIGDRGWAVIPEDGKSVATMRSSATPRRSPPEECSSAGTEATGKLGIRLSTRSCRADSGPR